MIKNYTYEINGQEDYKMAQHEINVLRDTYENVNVVEVHNNDGQVIAIMVEVY